MSLISDLFSIAAIGAGVFFFLAGTVGLVRFPDPLSRLHALTKADNLGLADAVYQQIGPVIEADSPSSLVTLADVFPSCGTSRLVSGQAM
jgi:multicomponent Na+:H+ antiporter subunit G